MANDARSRNRSLLHSRGLQISVVVVVAIIVAIVFYSGRSSAPTYFTSPAKVGNITSVVQATGVVNPVRTISIGAQVSGKIITINVDFNSKVKKNELIAQIDPSVYRAQLASAKADYANSQAAVISSQAQVAVAQANLAAGQANVEKADAALNQATLQKDRTVGLFQQGIVSASQRDTDVATYQTDLAELASAKAGLQQNQAALKSSQASVMQAQATVKSRQSAVDTAQTNLGYCDIYAPEDGVIINRAVDVGQTVASSFSAPLLFSEAASCTSASATTGSTPCGSGLDTMWVYVQTDESDVGRLKVGDQATFTVDAFPNTVYRGSIVERRKNATTVQNVVEYDTIIQFENTGEKLFPGMTAYVNIPVASAKNTLEVPNSALRFKPNMTPVQLRAVLAQYGMQGGGGAAGAGATGASRASASGSGAGAGGGGRQGGGGNRSGGGGGRQGGRGAQGANASGNKPTTTIMWTLDQNKQLVPVQVRTGITDFTYTAITRVLKGSLKSGDEVVTGELVKSATSGLPGTQRGGRGR